MSIKNVIELDFSSIVSIINPRETFLYCPNEKDTIEIKISKMYSDYETLREGMEILMEEAEQQEAFDE